MSPLHWIWQHPEWPHFQWKADALAVDLRECQQAYGQVLGMAGAVGGDTQCEHALNALLSNIVTSSEIEGEHLDIGSVRSSLARHLGMVDATPGRTTARSEGLAELMLDATGHGQQPLDLPRLMRWHHWLFPDEEDALLPNRIRIEQLRGEAPMQVVSGRIDRPRVHFEAPPRQGLEPQLDAFFDWFNGSLQDATLDPLLRAGIAHLWFVTLHPFDDGNGG